MADIFISYARADRERIEKLAAALEAEGYSVWWDRQIVGGAEFSEEIEKELATAKAVIVAWSAESVKSRWVKDEAVAAADAHKLIPVSLDGNEAPMGFRQFHLIDVSRWGGKPASDAFQDLTRAVKTTLTGERQAAPTPTKTSWTDKLFKPLPLAVIGASVLALVAVVFTLRSPGDEASAPDTVAAISTEPSIAVLPFADLSEGGDQAFFADGISEEILNVLVRIPDLKVAGRTSSFSFKGRNEDLREIGAALGVNHVLEGSVRRSGDKLRITAQLIRGEDGFHLWSETYDRELTDVFDIQDEIARAVAKQLTVSLGLSGEVLVADRTDDLEAYEKYLRAKALFIKRGDDNLDLAALLLGEVIARDPEFAPAWSALAGVYSVYRSYHLLASQETLVQVKALGRAAALRAITLNPNDGIAYAELGANTDSDDWVTVFEALDHAIALAPDDPTVLDIIAQNLVETGYLEEAKKHASRAVAIDPLHVIYRVTLARAYSNLQETDKAFAELEKARSLNPAIPFPYIMLLHSYVAQGKIDEAVNLMTDGVAAGAVSPETLENVRSLQGAWGDKDAIQNMIGAFDGGPYSIMISSLLGDREAVMSRLTISWTSSNPPLPMLFTSPNIIPFHDDPRWKEQVRRAGMLDLWRARGFPPQCRPLGADDFECD